MHMIEKDMCSEENLSTEAVKYPYFALVTNISSSWSHRRKSWEVAQGLWAILLKPVAPLQSSALYLHFDLE